MAEGLDRVRPPDPRRPADRDRLGKQALYSVGPDAPPPATVHLRCSRCQVERSLDGRELLTVLSPPFLVNPFRRGERLWARCPACGRRSWLAVRPGARLRRLVERPPS